MIKRKKNPKDEPRIDLSKDYEFRYWTERFVISKERLHQIIKKVGLMAKDVEKANTN